MDVYLPAQNPTHTAVLVCPGGGYRYLALDNEGAQPAQWLVAHGVAAFVLHYRVSPNQFPAPMLDASRAMRLLRSRAAEYDVAPDRIGVWGFSAGGHVASYLMTQFDAVLPEAAGHTKDAVDALSSRPDFGILAYPVVSMMPGITHPGSHDLLLGPEANAASEEQLSNDQHVQPTSPPAFVFATSDDPVVPVANSVLLYQAYTAKHIPIEMHLFEHGPHGMGLAKNAPGARMWPNLLADWMCRHGWMSAADANTGCVALAGQP
jgi:acetyl esterase/lipase